MSLFKKKTPPEPKVLHMPEGYTANVVMVNDDAYDFADEGRCVEFEWSIFLDSKRVAGGRQIYRMDLPDIETHLFILTYNAAMVHQKKAEEAASFPFRLNSTYRIPNSVTVPASLVGRVYS